MWVSFDAYDYICKLNELRNPLIYPGQKLLVPVKPESL